MACDPWPVMWPCNTEPTDSDPESIEAAVAAATELLWSRTGRRLGTCTVTEDYAPPGCAPCIPYVADGASWRGSSSHLWLAQSPVRSVTSVTVNGLLLDPSEYRLAGARLDRVAGAWPSSHGSVVTVVYTWGVPIEGTSLAGLVALAVGEVATEVLQAMCGGACRLSARAVSVTRAGVTVEMGSADDIAAAGKLGTEIADLLIDTVNPGGLRERSQVYSPDMAARVR